MSREVWEKIKALDLTAARAKFNALRNAKQSFLIRTGEKETPEQVELEYRKFLYAYHTAKNEQLLMPWSEDIGLFMRSHSTVDVEKFIKDIQTSIGETSILTSYIRQAKEHHQRSLDLKNKLFGDRDDPLLQVSFAANIPDSELMRKVDQHLEFEKHLSLQAAKMEMAKAIEQSLGLPPELFNKEEPASAPEGPPVHIPVVGRAKRKKKEKPVELEEGSSSSSVLAQQEKQEEPLSPSFSPEVVFATEISLSGPTESTSSNSDSSSGSDSGNSCE